MEAQGIAVAEAVGLPYSLKRVRVSGAMRLVPARLQIHVPPARLLGFVASNESLVPPWPRLIISIGRRSVPIALALKDVAKAYALHIQNPKVPKHRFDLIAAPIHDGYTGDNVVNTFGAVHSVTAERLAGAAQSFAAKNRSASPPAHRRAARRRELRPSPFRLSLPLRLAQRSPKPRATAADRCSLPRRDEPRRRRCAPLWRLSAAFPIFVWDGTGENPYYAFLASADAIVVTEDSVNMVTEAAGTGKPVYVQRLKGKSRRLSQFHELMRERGATRPFAGKIESWSYVPINDTEMVASVIRRALGLETTG